MLCLNYPFRKTKEKRTYNEARKTMNENKGGPFGAVITDKEGNIISVASNRVLELHDATAHAEVMAIRKAGEKLGTHDLSGCILYATGYPCPMCLSDQFTGLSRRLSMDQ